MNAADQVTDFKLSVDGRPATVQSLLKAINAFCGKLAEEYDFSTGPTLAKGDIPAKYWRLIAFAVEGSNEGYYVHVGALVKTEYTVHHGTTLACSSPNPNGSCPGHPQIAEHLAYIEFGVAKTYSSESAYAMAKEVSRFLAAASWN